MSNLLEVKDLKVHFESQQGFLWNKKVDVVKAVDGVSFSLEEGETLGLVGESGCGKSTTARAVMQLIPPTSGQVTMEGKDLMSLEGEDLRLARRNFQIVFQDPYASLNPRMTVGQIIAEPLLNFELGDAAERRKTVLHLLDEVGLPGQSIDRYPHEFSGGQRQRISIARALAPNPKLVICDEPVSALDVSVQAQILSLLQELQERYKLTYLFISHDLAVVRYISDRVAVMRRGKIVEMADATTLFDNAEHDYTKLLLSAVPHPDPSKRRRPRG
ncbi:MAG: ABC transporter ATP-binding protein [Deltaproteobacteria bacterium]|nr:MAG: ABC transporter ATP-binding protein [Deltaproteobacteria bacterium]